MLVACLIGSADFPPRAFADEKTKRFDLPPIQGLFGSQCTVAPVVVISDSTMVSLGPNAFLSIGKKREEKWRLTIEAAHGRNADRTPNFDWRLTYGYYNTRKQALNDCEKWMKRVEKAVKAEEKKQTRNEHPGF
jgi:hypothetical protein